MDAILDFIKGMTIWNWIALIAFIFFPLSALNAFFSLKSRYLDWRGTKSKKEFEQRSKQLEEQLAVTLEFIEHPTKLFSYVLHRGLRMFIFFLLGLAFFMCAVFVYASPLGDRAFPVASGLIVIGLSGLFASLTDSFRLFRIVTMVKEPARLADTVMKFAQSGKRKGYTFASDCKLPELAQAIIKKVDFFPVI